MPTERVIIREGNIPIILFAPHGFVNDDIETANIVKAIANNIDCYAVVNHGWERASQVNCFQDKADCNNIEHCKEEVVYEEILDPILRFAIKLENQYKQTGMPGFFMSIHGMGQKHRSLSHIADLDVVVGYGAGKPNSYTCELWRKDFILSKLKSAGYSPAEGKSGGPMSGWARKNMNQLFHKWHLLNGIQSMQFEIIDSIRQNSKEKMIFATKFGNILKELIKINNFTANEKFPSY